MPITGRNKLDLYLSAADILYKLTEPPTKIYRNYF